MWVTLWENWVHVILTHLSWPLGCYHECGSTIWALLERRYMVGKKTGQSLQFHKSSLVFLRTCWDFWLNSMCGITINSLGKVGQMSPSRQPWIQHNLSSPFLPLQFRPPDVSQRFTGLEALALSPESILVDSPDSRLMAQIIGQYGPKCQFPKPERFLCSLTYHLNQTEKLWHFFPTASF
jgi:hypothetical protein